MKMAKRSSGWLVMTLTVLSLMILFSTLSYAQPTNIRISARVGIGYSVDWVTINYRDARGNNQQIRRESNIDLGETAEFTVPDGATNIVLEAKPLLSLPNTRIFNGLGLASGSDHCFELTGSVNHPRYARVTCGWVPEGTVSVYDNTLTRNVGLKRVMVKVKDRSGIATIGTTYTDDNGHFSLNRPVTGPVRYELVFQDEAGLKVKWGANSHAQSADFDASEGPLHHTFRPTDEHKWYWATIYNACQFFKDFARQDALPMKSNAQVCGYYEDGTSTTPMTGIQDVILRVYGRDSRNIFWIVTHELSHVVHAQVDRNGYASFVGSWGLANSLRAAYGESWACGPQAIYTSRRYEPTSDELDTYQDDALDLYTYAERRASGQHLYIRPIVEDLRDNHNQRDEDNEHPLDRVSGYTLQQIAQALRGAHDLDDWKNNLKDVNNSTSRYLDEYFDQYFENRATRTSSNTVIKIKAVAGIGYTVDWVNVSYTDINGDSQNIRRNENISLGQEATITVPDGATNIRIEAKPLASLRNTRIFNNLSLTGGQSHCFHLTGSVNRPRYERVGCGS
jgi:hypothetical protein